MKRLYILLIWLLVLPIQAKEIEQPVHHDLNVTLQPEKKSLLVTDRVTLPKPVERLILELHAGLKVKFSSGLGEVKILSHHSNDYQQRYELKLPKNSNIFTVKYSGNIHHALTSKHQERSRGFRNTAGIIDKQGIFLAANSLWYPHFEGYPYMTYSLQVKLPSNWSSVSQGERLRHQADSEGITDHWQIDKPQEEIYLIGAPFTEYKRTLTLQQGAVEAQVFLREADQKLADKYLDATISYLKMYERLLGSYAYSKFALVENFWETGFGMPSFTLLGSRVIRLPFIINSSYPHEILHNWWGNGVYVDFNSGNWGEGLTAYLADHLIKEQQGKGAEYRQQSLQKYRDYAAKNRDFPLSRFKSRHNSATEAVGYGKTMMLFHMLRKKLGNKVFIQALQNLYREYRFRIASFRNVQNVFEQAAGRSLEQFFNQWVQRSGAPELLLKHSRVEKKGEKYQLELSIAQIQQGDVYALDIPVAISFNQQQQAEEVVIQMLAREQSYTLELDFEPTRVDIDPRFDLFRKLAIAETPPAFTQIFGADDLLVVIPANAESEMQTAWQAFANQVAHMGPERVKLVKDAEITELPGDRAVMVLGWENRFFSQLQQELSQHPIRFRAEQVTIGPEQASKQKHAFAGVTRVDCADNQTCPHALITADLPTALAGLGRKIPHYHKYSYLAFEGKEPQNRLKGRWPVTDSPMSIVLKANAPRGRLKKAAALIDPVSPFDAQRMLRSVRYLSSDRLQGRGLGSPGLKQAAKYIAELFKQSGLQPGGDNGGYFQHFTATGEDGEVTILKNVVGIIPGRHPQLSAQNVVFGAHYDHLGLGWPDVREQNRGQVHYGADDNASGVAVVLELARIMGGKYRPDRSIVFVAFSGEEAGRLGSKYYVRNQLEYPITKSIAMLNLDSVGRLFDKKLMLLGAETASEWPHIFRGIGFVTGISSVIVSEPLDASDQMSFHEVGVPAVQLFSGPHSDYHRPGDSADKIDAQGLVKVAEVSKQALEYLASRKQPMTTHLNNTGFRSRLGVANPVKKTGSRKVSLGTIPDFTYQGIGYRLDGVAPGSPAEQAGLQKQDVIVQINEHKINGLRDVSRVLKKLSVGDDIKITCLRKQQRVVTHAVLKSR